jgi:type II secretory pathway pseudopilin PulG
MIKMKTKNCSSRGFTIVEMIVIIVVIGILATVTVVVYNGIQEKARDTKRISDLQTISDAIKVYRINAHNDVQAGSGCGGSGNGSGWFNFANGTTYPDTILSCLTDAGYLDDTYVDPSGCGTTTVPAPGRSSCNPSGHPYMKYTCGTGDAAITYLYARLEAGGSEQDVSNANTCAAPTVVTSYHMNYMLVVK